MKIAKKNQISKTISNDFGLEQLVIYSGINPIGQVCSRNFEDLTIKTMKYFMQRNQIDRNIQTIDADSTVKTVYGKQGGSAVGYNPVKLGANSYHSQMLFCSEYKTLLHTNLRSAIKFNKLHFMFEIFISL